MPARGIGVVRSEDGGITMAEYAIVLVFLVIALLLAYAVLRSTIEAL